MALLETTPRLIQKFVYGSPQMAHATLLYKLNLNGSHQVYYKKGHPIVALYSSQSGQPYPGIRSSTTFTSVILEARTQTRFCKRLSYSTAVLQKVTKHDIQAAQYAHMQECLWGNSFLTTLATKAISTIPLLAFLHKTPKHNIRKKCIAHCYGSSTLQGIKDQLEPENASMLPTNNTGNGNPQWDKINGQDSISSVKITTVLEIEIELDNGAKKELKAEITKLVQKA
ncbi:hypothetical protein DFH27DRAFT_616020 [Peziza echinospora]|nr:hypothetical protein DFH27DRAFT_616020 [Peziza echinospora]